MKTQVIIAAAGAGTRLESDPDAPRQGGGSGFRPAKAGLQMAKPLILLKGKPLLVYSLEVFAACPLVESIIVVVGENNLEEFKKVIAQYGFQKVSAVVVGGATRCESVSNGLNVLDEDTELVVIHDGARPLISPGVLKKAIVLCHNESAVIAAVPVKPTIKRVNPEDLSVEATLDRSLLWEAQTPQVFKKDILLKAHKEVNDKQATDDASLLERLGEKIKIVEGEYRNIKITTSEDLIIAESFLAN